MSGVFALWILAGVPVNPVRAAAVDEVGQLYSSGQYTAALEAGRRALQAAPDDPGLKLLVGRSLLALGEPAAAGPLLEDVLARETTPGWRSGWAMFDLAQIRYGIGDVDAAVDLARRAIAERATANLVRAAEGFLAVIGFPAGAPDWSTIATERIRFRFHPALQRLDQRGFVQARLEAFAALQTWFGAALPKPIDYFIWPDNATARQAGLGILGFARPELSVIHSLPDQTSGHELTHVLLHHALHPKVRTGLVNEGVAVLFDQRKVDRLAVARAAVRRANLARLSIAGLWRDWPPGVDAYTYPVSGAFMERLRERGGDERFRSLLSDQSHAAARRIYGDDLDRWIAEFEAELFAGS